MQGLTVLYDARCRACCAARKWLGKQSQLVPLRFVAAGTEAAARLTPGIDPRTTLTLLHVIDDQGRIYWGSRAWIMCLWATHKYRPWAVRFAAPGMEGKAEAFVRWVSKRRFMLGARTVAQDGVGLHAR